MLRLLLLQPYLKLRDCLRAVSSFLVTIVFLSVEKFFTIIAKNGQKVNIYTTIPHGTNHSSGYNNHAAPCFSDLAPMRKTFSAITEKRTPKRGFSNSSKSWRSWRISFMRRYFSLSSVDLLHVLLLYTRLSKRL